MSDTPETDNLARGNHVVPTSFARDLERERNQWKQMYEDADWHTVEAEVFKRERDEARRLLACAKATAQELSRKLALLGKEAA